MHCGLQPIIFGVRTEHRTASLPDPNVRYPRSIFLFLFLTIGVQPACAQPKAERIQVAEAVAALPAELRDAAAVLGYRGESGELVKLRAGTNGMVCLADSPNDEKFHVACYHESLEPFMARGRRLRADSLERQEIMRIRREEIEAGTLPFPDHPAALYSLTGGSYNPESGEVEGAEGLHVIYLPYATPESTGLSTAPSESVPWLMFPGMPWAHVMISRK